MREELKDFEPFEVHLRNLNYFIHSKTVSLFLEPETEPPNSFQNLLQRCMNVFPQCNDVLLKSKTKTYEPHMTIAKFFSATDMKEELERIKANWKPISFKVKELYLLSRFGGNPFEVDKVIPLGSDTSPPYFGAGSPGSKENPDGSRLSASCVICDIPPSATNGVSISGAKKVEILQNPDGTARTCGVVEFHSMKDALESLQSWSGCKSSSYSSSRDAPMDFSYLIHLPRATFPCYGVEDCCSLAAVNKNSYRTHPN
uniref:Uncharacterized protein n=1 Tax=Arcella intermedia TaxID=1963864 RepID=A0A6B2LBL6_9EUKA